MKETPAGTDINRMENLAPLPKKPFKLHTRTHTCIHTEFRLHKTPFQDRSDFRLKAGACKKYLNSLNSLPFPFQILQIFRTTGPLTFSSGSLPLSGMPSFLSVSSVSPLTPPPFYPSGFFLRPHILWKVPAQSHLLLGSDSPTGSTQHSLHLLYTVFKSPISKLSSSRTTKSLRTGFGSHILELRAEKGTQ